MSSRQPSRRGTRKPKSNKGENEEHVDRCPTCNEESNDYMVQCDKCSAWYHHECVGLTEAIARALPSWYCNNCERGMISNAKSFADSMSFYPFASASSTMVANQNTTVIGKLPTEVNDETLVPAIEKDNIQSQRLLRAEIERQTETLEKEINRTMAELNKWVNKKQPKIMSAIKHKPSTTSNATSSRSSSPSLRDGNQKSTRMSLLEERERLIKLQIETISEKLKLTNVNNESMQENRNTNQQLAQPVFQEQVREDKLDLPYHAPNHLGRNELYDEAACLEPDVNNVPLNINHWMARQTVQPLPIFDGKPEDWQLFKSSFERTTKLCCFTNEENLDRLQHSLRGVAKQLVQGQFLLPKCVPAIMKNLEQAFGRPIQMLNVFLQKIRNQPAPQNDKPETLMRYAMSVRNLWSMMEASKMQSQMNNPQILQELINKLPLSFRYQWASHILNMKSYDVSTFASWLEKLVQKTTLIMPTIDMFATNERAKSSKAEQTNNNNGTVKRPQKLSDKIHAQEVKTKPAANCRVCGGNCKLVSECTKFTNGSNDERWKLIREFRICKQCLKRHPYGRGYRCKGWVKCTVPNCEGRHHPLLHKEVNVSSTSTENSVEAVATTTTSTQNVSNFTQRVNHDKPQLRYIPVILKNGNVKVKDFAFLDEGSTGTMMELSLANELNLKGIKSTLFIEYTAECYHTEVNTTIDGVIISGSHLGAKTFYLKNIQTVQKLGLASQTLDYVEVASQYSYLKGLPIDSYNEIRPRLLIGLNNWSCALPVKVRSADAGEPMAAKCSLGWSIFAGGCVTSEQRSNYHNIETEKGSLSDAVKYYFSIDSLGVKPPPDDITSLEERKAINLLKTTAVKIGDRYQIGLLWKNPNVKLPDNTRMALKRMHSLETKIARQPELAVAFHAQIAENHQLGYIRKLTQDELQEQHERIWYLPLLIAQNPNKPGKIRIVYDAAATVNGMSLNTALMKGPDPVNTMLGVQLRFRQHKVGIAGDIRHMFSQIQIRPQDQHVQRFYYREDTTKAPDVYVLQVMSFGATCSPASAMFVKNLNAENFRNQLPRAVHAIIDNHYVDDLLDGTGSIQETIQLAQEVKYIHSKAGFHIGKWKSNSMEVMQALDSSAINKTDKVNMNFEEAPETEKVLGMWWELQSDCYTYSLRFNKGNTDVLNGNRRPTKRDMLRILMSIYDPLGLIAQFLGFLKVLIQDVWRTNKDWDDPINDEQNEKWKRWIDMMNQLEDIQIPRCYLSTMPNWDDTEIQLHTFVDASMECVAAVSYLRIHRENEVVISIVSAKTKVAPIKVTSIPRLELTAALIGSRLANAIHEALTIKITRFVFWSDSKTVLCWLRSDTKRIKGQFVTFRVSEIQESTNITDWRYIPSRLNIADDATKWHGSLKISSSDRWFKGPPFLLEPEESWPEDKTINDNTEEEMHTEVVMVHHVKQLIKVQFHRFSKWNRLVRAMAFLMRYVSKLRKRVNNKTELTKQNFVEPLKSEELLKGEIFTYRVIQSECWPDEMSQLSKQECINNSKSKLYTLTPVIKDGIMRVKGRTGAILNVKIPDIPEGHMPLDSVQPIILSGEHYATKLLIRQFHEKYLHKHNETVVNEMRQKYHIPKLRQLLKKVIRSCTGCKMLTAKPKVPQMADLPQGRLMPFTRPFTFTGVDCMGPLEVTVGRRREKRWICLFTCLTVRAVHLEVLHKMDHDSFILVFRCFTQERGHPKKMFSDNGTNFVKAESVLREDLKNINMKTIAQHFESPQMEWHFNSPASPHMGGSWERLVKSVKQAFYSIPYHKTLNDQLLRSYIKEIQNIINSRPLTYLPLTSEESAALTPNDFLRGDTSGGHPIGHFCDDAKILKWNWQMSQLHANRFWRRWLVEYMPELTRRSKWFEIVDPLKPGDLVLIVDPDYTRNCWQRGKIEAVHVAKDGQVRSAIVRTTNGCLTRPAARLAKLDLEDCDLSCEQTRQDTGRKMLENVQSSAYESMSSMNATAM